MIISLSERLFDKLTAATCLPVPNWQNVASNSSDASIGSVVAVWCQPGTVSQQSSSNFTIVTCRAGVWRPAIPTCTGKILMLGQRERGNSSSLVDLMMNN
jgi:hypothetical protein